MQAVQERPPITKQEHERFVNTVACFAGCFVGEQIDNPEQPFFNSAEKALKTSLHNNFRVNSVEEAAGRLDELYADTHEQVFEALGTKFNKPEPNLAVLEQSAADFKAVQAAVRDQSLGLADEIDFKDLAGEFAQTFMLGALITDGLSDRDNQDLAKNAMLDVMINNPKIKGLNILADHEKVHDIMLQLAKPVGQSLNAYLGEEIDVDRLQQDMAEQFDPEFDDSVRGRA